MTTKHVTHDDAATILLLVPDCAGRVGRLNEKAVVRIGRASGKRERVFRSGLFQVLFQGRMGFLANSTSDLGDRGLVFLQ